MISRTKIITLLLLVTLVLNGLVAHKAQAIGISLFLPAVAFPSLQVSISAQQLANIADGKFDKNLILDNISSESIKAFGVPLASETRIVDQADLLDTLWQDRNAYTLLPFDALTTRYRVLLVDEVHPLDSNLENYAFAFPSDKPNYEPDKLTRFLLSGVTAFTRNTSKMLDKMGNQWAAEGIRDYTRRADFFHTSNEVSFDADCQLSGTGILRYATDFCAKDQYLDLLIDLGLDIVELTGNHNNDYGFKAYRRTLEMYQENNMLTVGGGNNLAEARKPLILEHNGNHIAMFSCNYAGPEKALATDVYPGAAYCDKEWVNQTLPQLARDNDVVIVTTQYRELDSFNPLDDQRTDFKHFADLGATMVIGTQAHQPQIFEFYKPVSDRDVLIHYGLGNLYFDFEYYRSMFFMDELFIYKGKLLIVNVFTGIIQDYAQPRPMKPGERQTLLGIIMKRSFPK